MGGGVQHEKPPRCAAPRLAKLRHLEADVQAGWSGSRGQRRRAGRVLPERPVVEQEGLVRAQVARRGEDAAAGRERHDLRASAAASAGGSHAWGIGGQQTLLSGVCGGPRLDVVVEAVVCDVDKREHRRGLVRPAEAESAAAHLKLRAGAGYVKSRVRQHDAPAQLKAHTAASPQPRLFASTCCPSKRVASAAWASAIGPRE